MLYPTTVLQEQLRQILAFFSSSSTKYFQKTSNFG